MDNADIRRTPPFNKEAEQAVLGSVFLNPQKLVEVAEFVTAEDFYVRAHRLIFAAMSALSDRDEAIDVVTVQDYLDAHNQLDDIGGVGYVVELADAVPTAANAVYYAKIVAEKAQVRRLIATAESIAARGYDEQADVPALLETASDEILSVADTTKRSGFRHIKDVLNATVSQIDKLYQNDSQITGLPTGFVDLDKITTGLHDGELVIIAARPAVGKTAFALNIAQNVGTKTGKTVAIFSLEMGAEQLVSRMLCAEGSVDANHVRTGQLDEQEWESLVVAMGSLSQADIYIDDTPGIRMAQIRSSCLKLQQEHDLGLVVVDYLQLIEGSGENRQQEVSAISRAMKKLAKELGVPVIALSQLSRGVEQRQDKRPVLSDIRESGSIEQDADIVAFLYREDYYRSDDDSDDEDQGDQNVGPVEVIIEKNRSGARGTVNLLFVKSYNKFTSVAVTGLNQPGPTPPPPTGAPF
ncbi:replicative DNA helicase [Lacticaseibacillus nasuensis]|uniref:Replicative DNA helicase n=1 Tax=Lacticaseibacillus nasuensis JCM 17158 TaxID=1291734 RepID=A0A0R1JRT0_9LACO|nr:replicative DNA helicase [Lacticaseibacillus nasuensis]KRK73832.1 primary replicative DNA helicase [Lacticaseibacillus nasuensis JCM 17158]